MKCDWIETIDWIFANYYRVINAAEYSLKARKKVLTIVGAYSPVESLH